MKSIQIEQYAYLYAIFTIGERLTTIFTVQK